MHSILGDDPRFNMGPQEAGPIAKGPMSTVLCTILETT